MEFTVLSTVLRCVHGQWPKQKTFTMYNSHIVMNIK